MSNWKEELSSRINTEKSKVSDVKPKLKEIFSGLLDVIKQDIAEVNESIYGKLIINLSSYGLYTYKIERADSDIKSFMGYDLATLQLTLNPYDRNTVVYEFSIYDDGRVMLYDKLNKIDFESVSRQLIEPIIWKDFSLDFE